MALLSESEFHTYSATLFADDNKPPRNWTGLKSTDGEAGKVVSIKVPTALLPAGTYHVKLRGGSSIKEMKDISTYYFEVLQR